MKNQNSKPTNPPKSSLSVDLFTNTDSAMLSEFKLALAVFAQDDSSIKVVQNADGKIHIYSDGFSKYKVNIVLPIIDKYNLDWVIFSVQLGSTFITKMLIYKK